VDRSLPAGRADRFLSRPVAARLAELLGPAGRRGEHRRRRASIGTDRLARSPADGYNGGPRHHRHARHQPASLRARACPYDALKDFTPLTLAARYVNVL